MELDILTLSQQMKSSFMLACTFHMKKNIVRISFISTSNGNKPAKKGNSTPIFFYSTTSTNREKKFYLRKFFTRKMLFFLYSELKWKTTKKRTEMLSGTNSITIITPPWVVPHNTQHTGLGTEKRCEVTLTHSIPNRKFLHDFLYVHTYVHI